MAEMARDVRFEVDLMMGGCSQCRDACSSIRRRDYNCPRAAIDDTLAWVHQRQSPAPPERAATRRADTKQECRQNGASDLAHGDGDFGHSLQVLASCFCRVSPAGCSSMLWLCKSVKYFFFSRRFEQIGGIHFRIANRRRGASSGPVTN